MKAAFGWIRWKFILLLAALTPPCRGIARLASLARERPLGFWTRLRIRVHLRICDGCERYLRQLDVLHRAAGRLGESFPDAGRTARLAADAKERLKARLRCERAKG
jgi:hypothetical protein